MKIDNEIKSFIPELSKEEFNQLEESIKNEGCRDAIVLWGDIIVDGHNRFSICEKHDIKYRTIQREFTDKNAVKIWVIENQLGRRNMNNYQKGVLVLALKPLYEARAKENQIKHGLTAPGKNNTSANLGESVDVREELAKKANISHGTMAKIMKIEASATPEAKARLCSGQTSIDKEYQLIVNKETSDRMKSENESSDQHVEPSGNFDLKIGNFKEHIKSIADESVTLILTELPYPKEYVDVWKELAMEAKRVLKPGGFMILHSQQNNLPELINILGEHLTYYWLGVFYKKQKLCWDYTLEIMNKAKPTLFYYKEPLKAHNGFVDIFQNDSTEYPDWYNNEKYLRNIISVFSKSGDTILDPFMHTNGLAVIANKKNRLTVGFCSKHIYVETSMAVS